MIYFITLFSLIFMIQNPSFASDDFYTELRKQKNPTQVEIDEIRDKTLEQKRRIRLNQLSTPEPISSLQVPLAPIRPSSFPQPKVNPGDIDELNFPGEAKPKAKQSK